MGSPAARYAELVAGRKGCDLCKPGLINPSKVEDGTHDGNQIGPWTLWQGNLVAKLVVVGQDWGDTSYFSKNKGHESRSNPTNETLRDLLRSVKIEIPSPSIDDNGEGVVFLTNAILSLKEGGLQAKVEPEWFSNCGKKFLRPTIELVAPKVVVSLGEAAYRSLTAAWDLRRMAFRSAVETVTGFRLGSSVYFPMYHCGARIQNTHRPLTQQYCDWQKVAAALDP